MIRTALRSALVVLLVASCKQPTREVNADNLIIARVDGSEVTRSSFQSYLRYSVYLPDAIRSDEAGESRRTELSDEVNSRLLDNFLDERALLQRARAEGLQATPDEIDRFAQSAGLGALADLQMELPLTQREFLERYLEESCLVKQLLARTALRSVQANEDELRATYDANLADYTTPRRYRIRGLHLDTKKEAIELEDKIRRRGDVFITVADELASGDNEDQGKDLGIWAEDALPEAFAAALAGLQTGDVSEVVEDPDGGYNILYVTAMIPSEVRSYEQVHDLIHRQLTNDKKLAATRAFTDSVRAQATVEIVPENLGFGYVARDVESGQPPTQLTEQPSSNGGPS